jgi:hypothetical protein
MEYNDFKNIVEKGGFSINKFFGTTSLSIDTINGFKKDNFIPSYVELMFKHYLSSIVHKNHKGSYEDKRDAFLLKARESGYCISGGFVEIPVFSNKPDFEIDEFESQFVKFSYSK